ncbi:hypothetical protein [Paenibacillus sp. FSL H8-0079]
MGTMVLSQEVAIPADLTEVDTEDLQAEDFTDIVSFSGNRDLFKVLVQIR